MSVVASHAAACHGGRRGRHCTAGASAVSAGLQGEGGGVQALGWVGLGWVGCSGSLSLSYTHTHLPLFYTRHAFTWKVKENALLDGGVFGSSLSLSLSLTVKPSFSSEAADSIRKACNLAQGKLVRQWKKIQVSS